MPRRSRYRQFKVLNRLDPSGSRSGLSDGFVSIVDKFNNYINNKFNSSIASKVIHPPDDNNWLLNDGIWNDGGIWWDDEVWYDN